MKKEIPVVALLLVSLAIGFLLSQPGTCKITNSTSVELDYAIGYQGRSGPVVVGTSMEDVARYSGIWSPFAVYKPLEGRLSELQIPEGMKSALIGKTEGDTIVGVAEHGFPARNESLVLNISTAKLPHAPAVGEPVTLGKMSGIVTNVGNGTATVDFNPPYAGKPMVYRVEIIKASC